MATPTVAAPREWCDAHGGPVDEGHTRLLAPGSAVMVCDACADEAIPRTITTAYINGLMERVPLKAVPIEDRAAILAVLHALQLRINRVIRPVKAELAKHMLETGTRSMGPVMLKSTPKGMTYPCNAPGNWGDIGVQDAMEVLRRDPATRPYIRHVPEHLEIDPVALGEDVVAGLSTAVRLHRELTLRGWRTEEGRTYSIVVAEAAS